MLVPLGKAGVNATHLDAFAKLGQTVAGRGVDGTGQEEEAEREAERETGREARTRTRTRSRSRSRTLARTWKHHVQLR